MPPCWTGEEDMRWSSELRDGDIPAFQIADRTHAVRAEQLEAPDMASSQDHDGVSGCNPDHIRRREVHCDVDLASRQGRLDLLRSLLRDVLDVGEPLATQELFGDVLRSNAD